MARTKGDYVRRLVALYRASVVAQEMEDRKKYPQECWEQLHVFHCSRVHYFAEQLITSPRSARVHEQIAWQEIERPPKFNSSGRAGSVLLAQYRELNEQFEKHENGKAENKNKSERIHTFYCDRVTDLWNASEEQVRAHLDSEIEVSPNLSEYLKDFDCNGCPHWEFRAQDEVSEGDSCSD